MPGTDPGSADGAFQESGSNVADIRGVGLGVYGPGLPARVVADLPPVQGPPAEETLPPAPLCRTGIHHRMARDDGRISPDHRPPGDLAERFCADLLSDPRFLRPGVCHAACLSFLP